MGHDRNQNDASKDKDTDAEKGFGNTATTLKGLRKKTPSNYFMVFTYLNSTIHHLQIFFSSSKIFQTCLHLKEIYNSKTPRPKNQKLQDLALKKLELEALTSL